MYKYFVSFAHVTDNNAGLGNIVIESKLKAEKLKTSDDITKWINEVQQWIEKNCNVKNVVILNFKIME